MGKLKNILKIVFIFFVPGIVASAVSLMLVAFFLWRDYQTGKPEADFGEQAEKFDRGIEIRRGLGLVDAKTQIRGGWSPFCRGLRLEGVFDGTF